MFAGTFVRECLWYARALERVIKNYDEIIHSHCFCEFITAPSNRKLYDNESKRLSEEKASKRCTEVKRRQNERVREGANESQRLQRTKCESLILRSLKKSVILVGALI